MHEFSIEMSRSATNEGPSNNWPHEHGATTGDHGIVTAHILEQLGPWPKKALHAMVDYGLNDEDISRYYAIPVATIRQLRHAFDIHMDN